ncbi:MAG: redox-sensing transcriptional repressor Rex [Gemmataceae bacterium]
MSTKNQPEPPNNDSSNTERNPSPSSNKKHESSGPRTELSRASLGRYSLYLRYTRSLNIAGTKTVSSGQLGDALGITDAQVRKDLAYLGNLGHRGVGYPIPELMSALRAILGVNRNWSVVIVGVGNLARALLRYQGFREQGFDIVALFDDDQEKVGQTVEGLLIQSLDELSTMVAQTKAELAILTVPSEVAQEVADTLVNAGIRGILNFAPVVLHLPSSVQLVTVDLAAQLEQLASLIHLGTNDTKKLG